MSKVRAGIRVGLLLKRNPITVPRLNEFEGSYVEYKEGLDRATSRPFNSEFYFKKGTTQQLLWEKAEKSSKK
jgi:large subunit ribosomal protein L46